MYLYHYTTIDSLAMILHNKSIKFSNLLYVDDVEECQTSDMGKFGRFVYVSCWTNQEKESISMWDMYSDRMTGVRIKLPEFPFRKYYFKKDEFHCIRDIETFMNIEKVYQDNKFSITNDQPLLIKVIYTDDKNLIYPQVKTESAIGATKKFMNIKNNERYDSFEVKYSFDKLGRYKNTDWTFQNEYRYIITTSPMGLKEFENGDMEKHKEFARRMEDLNYEMPNSIFLEIDNGALSDMEIKCGPKMPESKRIIVDSLIKLYAPNCRITDSSIKVQ